MAMPDRRSLQRTPRVGQTRCRGGPAPAGHQAPQSPQRQEPATSRSPSPGPLPRQGRPAPVPVQGLGPRASPRSRRGVGAVSAQRCPCPGAPTPVARSHTGFTHCCWGPPTQTHVGTKRGKGPRTAGVWWGRPECQGLPRDRGTIHRENVLLGGPHTATPWEEERAGGHALGVGSGAT